MADFTPPPGAICARCEKRPATHRWDWAPAHFGGWRCEVCVIEVQLEHARNQAAVIPELESRLAELVPNRG